MKWTKPKVTTYREETLLAKLAAKAQTHIDYYIDQHTDYIRFGNDL